MKNKSFGLGKFLFGFGVKSNYHLAKWFGLMAILMFAFIDGSVAGDMALAITPALAVLTDDEQKIVDNLKSHNQKLLDSFKADANELVGKLVTEGIDKKELDKTLADFQTKYEELSNVNIDQITDNIKAVQEKQVELGKALKKAQTSNMDNTPKAQLENDLKAWVEGEDFKAWREGVDRGKGGNSPMLSLKYSLTGAERTGLQLVTSRSTMVGDAFQPRRVHVRDLLQVVPTDMPNHVFDQVTSWIAGIDMNSENGEAANFDINTKEKTVNSSRIAGYMDISNNSLKSAAYLTRHIMNRAPEKLLNVEDFQLIFGDGSGNNVEGFKKNSTAFDLTGPEFIAGAIASVASYDGGASTLVTFAASHNLTSAYKIDFGVATNYTGVYSIAVKSELQIVINAAYVAETATTWTATTDHYLKGTVDGAQEWDVLIATAAFMANSEYRLSSYVLNPATAAKIEMLKATDLQYIGKIERINGVLFISGVPVIEHNSMPADEFLGGDFQMATELQQYEGVTMRFIEDAEYARKNKQMLLISEQIVLPIYNPFMFVSGNFTAAKAQLETA